MTIGPGSERPVPHTDLQKVRHQKKEFTMPRAIGERYVCEKCGSALVYEKACPCPEGMPHSEICCGQQMKQAPQE